MKRLFIFKSVQKARERRKELSKLQKNMENLLLLLQMMGVDVKEDGQEVKSQQALLFASAASKIIFLSRVCTAEQDETCSSSFFQKVHKASSVTSSLMEEDSSVTSSQSDILRINKSFYAGLYDMKPTDRTDSQSFLSSIMEALDNSTKDTSPREVTIPCSGGLQVKASLYMEDITVFWSHPLSVHRLMSIRDRLKLASRAKNAPNSWTVPYHLFFMKKFAKKNKSIRKWSACSTFKILWKRWILVRLI
eukprot:g43550.t1